jgi:hypothetical protein
MPQANEELGFGKVVSEQPNDAKVLNVIRGFVTALVEAIWKTFVNSSN